MFLGNGIMSPRFGYSTNMKDYYLKFHACAFCISSLESGISPVPCECCACWNTLSPHVRFRAPKHYPPELCPPGNMLPGIKFSFQSIMNSQVLAVKKFIDGLWGEDTVKSYLSYEGSNSEQALCVVHFSKRKKECKEQRCLFEEEEPWKPLSTIPVMELDDFVDAPVHLLFLGIVKAVFQIVVARLSRKDCLAPLCRKGNVLMEAHGPWLSIVPF
jgi:hypothetical protein